MLYYHLTATGSLHCRELETRQQEARSQQAEPQARAHCPVVEVRPTDL